MARKKSEQPVMRGVKAAVPFDDRPLFPAFVSASVMPGEPASSAYTNNTGRDFEQTARGVVGTMYRAANINATYLSGCTLRLYRKAGRGNKRYLTRAVKDARTLRYLCGEADIKPTRCKGANYAAKAGADVEEVLDHPILDVLQNPDPVYTGQVWMHLLWWFKEVCGRSYLYAADRVNGVPTSLYILPSCYTWPVKSTTGLISEFVYARNRTAMMRCKPEEIVYLRHQANPFDPVGAMAWTQCVVAESDMEAAALQAEVARWINGGMPGMVLKAPPTTNDQQMAQMNAALQQRIQGVGKAGSILLLRDTELIQYATKPHDMQYVEGMSATEKRIYDAAGIPESIYRLNSANLASAQVADGQYAKLTIAPRLATMASELTELMLPMFGVEPGEMWFMFDSPVRDDVVALAEQYRQGELSGIVYPNEYRHVLGLEALPDEQNALRYRQTEAPAPAFPMFGGSTGGTQNAGPASVDEDVAENEGDTEEAVDPMDAEDDDAEPTNGESDGNKSVRSDQCGTVGGVDCGCDHAAGKSGSVGVAGDKPGPGAGRQLTIKTLAGGIEWDDITGVPKPTIRILSKFTTSMNAWYESVIPMMVNDSVNMNQEMVDALGVPTVAEQMTLPVPAVEVEKMQKIAADFTRDVLAEGGAAGIARLPDPTDATYNTANEPAMAYIRNRGLELAKSVPETLKGNVQAAIESELGQGTTVAQMRDAITRTAPELSGYQAERLARTETSMAFNEGQRQGWQENGVEGRELIIGGGPCPTCEALFAKYGNNPIPINEPYTLDGAAWSSPPFHPNCRCGEIPVQYMEPES